MSISDEQRLAESNLELTRTLYGTFYGVKKRAPMLFNATYEEMRDALGAAALSDWGKGATVHQDKVYNEIIVTAPDGRLKTLNGEEEFERVINVSKN